MSYEARNTLASRVAVQNRAGELLLLRRWLGARHNAGLWEFPGGGVRVGRLLDHIVTEGRLQQNLESDRLFKAYFTAKMMGTAMRENWEEGRLVVLPKPPLLPIEERDMTDTLWPGAKYVLYSSPAVALLGNAKVSPEHTELAWERFDAAMGYDLAPQTRMAAVKLGELGLLQPR